MWVSGDGLVTQYPDSCPGSFLELAPDLFRLVMR
jgi:hypothetical protein